MGPGTSFHRVLHEDVPLCDDREVKRVVLCSGKVYYDLFEEREKRGIKDICFLRLEQLYPFPPKALTAELARGRRPKCVWCQEEPQEHGRLDLRAPRDRIGAGRHQAQAERACAMSAGRPRPRRRPACCAATTASRRSLSTRPWISPSIEPAERVRNRGRHDRKHRRSRPRRIGHRSDGREVDEEASATRSRSTSRCSSSRPTR